MQYLSNTYNRAYRRSLPARAPSPESSVLKSFVLAAGALCLAGLSQFAAAQHLDVKISTSNGPVAGSKILVDVYGDIAWYLGQAGGLPIRYDTGTMIFPANFNDLPGGPFATDNPGFQTFRDQFVRDEELAFRAHGQLQYLPVGGTEWTAAAPGGGIRVMGSIPQDIVFDYVYNGVREAEYLFYEAGTLFTGAGVVGPTAAPIAGASAQGAFHYHMDWYLEGTARSARGFFLVEMSLYSTAVSGGQPKYLESDRFHVIFRNDVSNDEFAAAMLTLTQAPVMAQPVPEPGTWALMAGGLGLLGAAARRRRAGR